MLLVMLSLLMIYFHLRRFVPLPLSQTRRTQSTCKASQPTTPPAESGAHTWKNLIIYHVLHLRVLAFTETGVSEKEAVGNFAPDLQFMEMDIVHGMTAR